MRPFTGEAHEALRAEVEAFAARVAAETPAADAARELAAAGLLRRCVPAGGGGTLSALELVVVREALAGWSAQHDALFAVQALAALPIARGGRSAARDELLARLAAGNEVAAFALTEREGGSDPAALATRAHREPDGGYRIDGEKVLISGAGAATIYVVFARTGDGGEARPLSAFVVPAAAPGIAITATPMLADHALGTVRFDGVRVPEAARLGAEGDGLRLALGALELMRPTVGAAACGMARRAFDAARAFVAARTTGGAPLADRDSVRMRLAEMATELDAARLLVYRAAWLRDGAAQDARLPTESSMAKLYATEAAQRIVDAALQLHGGAGILRGSIVERLYRDVRALRLYEGTSEIQRLIIARALS